MICPLCSLGRSAPLRAASVLFAPLELLLPDLPPPPPIQDSPMQPGSGSRSALQGGAVPPRLPLACLPPQGASAQTGPSRLTDQERPPPGSACLCLPGSVTQQGVGWRGPCSGCCCAQAGRGMLCLVLTGARELLCLSQRKRRAVRSALWKAAAPRLCGPREAGVGLEVAVGLPSQGWRSAWGPHLPSSREGGAAPSDPQHCLQSGSGRGFESRGAWAGLSPPTQASVFKGQLKHCIRVAEA